jgi:hypothetical protein
MLPLVTAKPTSTLCPIRDRLAGSDLGPVDSVGGDIAAESVSPPAHFDPVRQRGTGVARLRCAPSGSRPHIKVNSSVGTRISGLGIHRACVQCVGYPGQLLLGAPSETIILHLIYSPTYASRFKCRSSEDVLHQLNVLLTLHGRKSPSISQREEVQSQNTGFMV